MGNSESKKTCRTLFCSIVILTFCLVLIVFACIVMFHGSLGWFSSNGRVSATGMNTTVSSLPYELAVPNSDNIGPYSYVGTGEDPNNYTGTPLNEFPTGPNTPDGTSGTYTTIEPRTGTFYTTDGSNVTILWRLSSAYSRTDEGVGPSSEGSFTFYIFPKVDGTLNVKFSLALIGYNADVEENEDRSFNVSNLTRISENDSDYEGVTYLNTHMLFFTGRSNVGTNETPIYEYSGLLDSNNIEMTFTNCSVDTLIPVTFYYIWPNTFAQMCCVSDTRNVSSDQTTVSALQQYVVANASIILKDFTQARAMTHMATATTVDEDTVYTFNSAQVLENISILSTGYNKADQSIGTVVKYFLLELTAGQ